MATKLLGANAKSYRLQLKLKLSRLVSTSTDCPPATVLYIIIIIIIEGLSLLQSIPPTTADKQTQAQKRRGSRYCTYD